MEKIRSISWSEVQGMHCQIPVENIWKKYERTESKEASCGPDVDMCETNSRRRSNGGDANVVCIRDCSDDRRNVSSAVQRLNAALKSRELTYDK